jgi:O-antigen ligase
MLSALDQAPKYKVLGVLCALPLSVSILSREVMLLHLFAVLPLGLWMLWRRRAQADGLSLKLTPIDRITLVYFAWAAVSLLVNLLGLHDDGASATVPRLLSTAATVMYWLLPFLIGRLIFDTDEELRDFFDGLVLGAAVTCLILLAGYAYAWFVERPVARHAIGQRSVLVLTFISILVIFVVRSRPLGYLLAFLLWLTMILSATRASLGQWLLTMFLVLTLARTLSLRQRSALAATALAALFVGFSVGDAPIRIAWMGETSVTVTEEKGVQVQTKDDSSNIRMHIWSLLSAKAFQDLGSTVFGFGQLGPSFVAEAFDYKGHRIEMFSAHSEYLDQILRSGIVGVALFLCLLIAVIGFSLRQRRHPGPLGPAFYGVGFGLVGAAFYSVVHESVRYPWFGVIFWLIVGALSSVLARQARSGITGAPDANA